MKKNETIITRLVKQPWFFSASLFLGLIISGNVDSEKDFYAILFLCLFLWLLDSLFLKKGITILLNKVLNLYKRWTHDLVKKN
jgi:hypothetical protein